MVEVGHDAFEALVLLAHEVLHRNFAVVEHDQRGSRRFRVGSRNLLHSHAGACAGVHHTVRNSSFCRKSETPRWAFFRQNA